MEPDQCRFCFRQDSSVIFDLINCIEAAKKLTQIEFLLSDRLPDKVCKECFNRIFDAIAMREICVTSENMLQAQLNDIEALEDNVKFKYEIADEIEEEPLESENQVEVAEEMEYILEAHVKEEIACNNDIIEVGEVIEDQCEDYAENQESITEIEIIDENESQDVNENEAIEELSHEKKKMFQKCCQCRKAISCRKEEIDAHMIQFHCGNRMKNSPRYRDAGVHCRLCWQSFPSARDREAHLEGKTVKKRIPQEYICALCGAKFTSEMEFYRHQESLHEAEFNCESCQKIFKTAKQYYTHVHAVHKTGIFVCELCGQSFNRRYMLQDHKNIHNNIRPFVCSICGSSFSRKSVLRSHYRCHTGEKPYSCDHCEKAFSYATDLKRHQVVHTGKYLYECSICSKGFNRKKTAMEHIELCESGVATKSGVQLKNEK